MSNTGNPAVVQLEVAHRNFIYMRGFAVKSTSDALVELITNAVDAYRRIDGYESMNKTIKVIFYHVKNDDGTYKNYVSVIDNAIGVDPDNMRQCFLTAGNLTAEDNSRGFFSTGAKNITALGDAHFTSIKDGKLSKVYLDMDGYGHIVTHGELSNDTSIVPDVVGVDVTDKQREILGIPENGLNVTLEYISVDEQLKLSSATAISEILNNISKIGSLRTILSDQTYNIETDIRIYDPHLDILNIDDYELPTIHLDTSKYVDGNESGNYGGQFISRLSYSYPKANILLSTTFNVPNYEEYTCTFVIYKSDKPLREPRTEKHMEFGFMIKDSTSVYEVNTLFPKYRWNPNIKYLYGYVHCDGFRAELLKSDQSASVSLMDPNRDHMNYDHPLYQSIMSVCSPRLDKSISEVQNEATYKSINIDELDAIVSKLEDLGVSIFDENEITFDFVADDESDVAIAIQSTENHIVREISGEVNLRNIPEDSITIENLEDKKLSNNNSQYVYYYNSDNDLTPIEVPDNINLNNPSDPSDVTFLQSIVNDLSDLKVENPFLFRMKDGEWSKIKVFVKGRIERQKDDNDSLLKIQHKSLTIKFINDINYKEKYLVDITNGVSIKINLHNEIVAEKLSKEGIDALGEGYSFKLSDEASYDALNFLEGLITAAFTDIIVSNDILNGRIDTTDEGATMAKKIVKHRAETEAEIETTIHGLFNIFIQSKKDQMKVSVKDTVEIAKSQVLEMFLSNTSSAEEVELQAQRLGDTIEQAVVNLLYS
jgi:hypothetical protein